MKRRKSRTPLDYVNLCVWAWTRSAWEIFSFLTWTSGSAWELISPLSERISPHTLGFALFIPHCDSGKNFAASFFFVFHLHGLLAWMIFARLERNVLGETYRGLCEKFSLRFTVKHLKGSWSLFLNTVWHEFSEMSQQHHSWEKRTHLCRAPCMKKKVKRKTRYKGHLGIWETKNTGHYPFKLKKA